MNDNKVIKTHKTVLKAAESVWATNKYFVLACSQRQYRQIRSHFRPDQRNLPAAYEILKQTEAKFNKIKISDLPELPNALYHVMGYFKKVFSQEEKQAMNIMIKEHPEKALRYLEEQTFQHHIKYLLPCRLWSHCRNRYFNGVPISLIGDGQPYLPYSWLWKGSYLVPNERQ